MAQTCRVRLGRRHDHIFKALRLKVGVLASGRGDVDGGVRYSGVKVFRSRRNVPFPVVAASWYDARDLNAS